MAESQTTQKSFGLRNTVSKDSEHFQPESGRYDLYIAYPCPFAHRALFTRKLKGLEDHIGLFVLHPVFQKTKPDVDDHTGWVFRKETDEPLKTSLGFGSVSCEGCIPDTVNNFKTLREMYEVSGNVTDKYSVPVLWDKKNKTIVNNESGDLIRIFNSGFNNLAKHPEIDLYPEALRGKIDETNEWLQNDINTGVYKAGFAKDQESYSKAVNNLFAALDKAEEILNKNRYLLGEQFTESDIRLFTTLLRFDEIYYVLFKCNKKKIADYPSLFNYCREIYQMPGIAETVNLDHAKKGYFMSRPEWDYYGIVPVGQGQNFLNSLKEKHNRELIK